MKCRYIVFIVFLLFVLQTANAESDFYTFSIQNGSNSIDLGTSYDGNHVNSIRGVFYPSPEGALHKIKINITSETARDNATMKLEIPYNQYMNPDFSDLLFQYENNTSIQYYVDSQTNGSNATVYLKMDVFSGLNTIYLLFDNSTAVSQSNATGMFLYMLNNPTGSYYSGGTYNLYIGDYTNVEFSAVQRYNNTNSSRIYLSDGNYPSVNKSSSYTVFYLNSSNYVRHTNNTSVYSASLDATNLSKSVAMISNNEKTGYTSQPNRFRIYNSGSGTNATIYKVQIYNSTSFTYSFGAVEDVAPDASEQVSFDVPTGIFSTISQHFERDGYLELYIDYEPHLFMLTPNGANLTTNTILQFQTHPTTMSTTYQIALDSDYYSIVNSGTSDGNITLTLPEATYFWRLMQLNGTYTETRAFTVNTAPAPPGYLNIRVLNELNNTNVSATVKLTNDTTTLQKSGNNITFNSTEIISGNYSIQINATDYTTRFYEVISPGNYTLYMLPVSNNVSTVYFSLIDNTNTFQYDSTKLEIIKTTPNGSILIQNSYFDVSGFVVATLNQFDNYILKVVSDSGHERILGNYIQAGQTTTQLVISDIDLKDSNMSVHAGFRYNLTKSDEAVKFDWLNPNNSLKEPLLFQIYKNNELVMNISTGAPFGSINYYDNVAGEMKLDPDATYRIVMTAKTANGTIKINEYYKVGEESVGIDFEKIPLALRIVISLILLILVASMFNITNAKFASIVVSFIALFLAGLIGFLPISVGLLVWMLFISVVAFKTNR